MTVKNRRAFGLQQSPLFLSGGLPSFAYLRVKSLISYQGHKKAVPEKTEHRFQVRALTSIKPGRGHREDHRRLLHLERRDGTRLLLAVVVGQGAWAYPLED